jgi:colicin import membrane protein
MVRVNSIGSILSRGIVNSSGNKAWEDAVLRAIDKMETLPRDTDGTIPAIVIREGLELTVTL